MIVYEKMPFGYDDADKFGDPGKFTVDELKVVLDNIIIKLLPDCMALCGDELVVSEEDAEGLDSFDLDETISEAYDELFDMTDDEVSDVLKGVW